MMNALANFPLPYEGEQPNDAIAKVMTRVRIVGLVIDQAMICGMTADLATDVRTIVYDIEDELKPILGFLNKLDVPGVMDRYQAARREAITSA